MTSTNREPTLIERQNAANTAMTEALDEYNTSAQVTAKVADRYCAAVKAGDTDEANWQARMLFSQVTIWRHYEAKWETTIDTYHELLKP